MKKKTGNLSQKVTYWSGVVIIGLLVGLSLQFVRAWTEPSAIAPGTNIAGPVNVSNIFQSKAGSLQVLGLGIIAGKQESSPGVSSGAALVIPNGDVVIGKPTLGATANSKTGIIDTKDAWIRDANGGAGAWASALGGGGGSIEIPAPSCFTFGPNGAWGTTVSTCPDGYYVKGIEQTMLGQNVDDENVKIKCCKFNSAVLAPGYCTNPNNSNLILAAGQQVAGNLGACSVTNPRSPSYCQDTFGWLFYPTGALRPGTQSGPIYTCQNNGSLLQTSTQSQGCTGWDPYDACYENVGG